MIVIRLNGHLPIDTLKEQVDRMVSIPGCCDVCWIGVGGYDINFQETNAARMYPLVEYIHSKGLRCAYEFNGLGHGDSRSPRDVSADLFEKMTGPDGFVADGAFCPRGENIRSYYRKMASFYAATKPDGMYIDDDLRMDFHGRVPFGCLCDDCIALFNKEYGYSFTRETLVKAIATDSEVRARYGQQTVEAMGVFMRNFARAAHEVSPATQIGYEYVYLTEWSTSAWEPVFRAIREETGLPPLSRPGCFFYEDHEPRKMLDKVLNTSYQNAICPDYVISRRPEVENCSHTVMGKSVQGCCTESTLNLAYGCNGLSYSMLSANTEELWHRERMWQAFARHRNYWAGLIEDEKPGTGVGGVALAWHPDSWKTVLPDDKGFDWVKVPKAARSLCEVGLPVSYEKDYCKVTVLSYDSAARLPEEEIRRLLAGRVLADGFVLDVLKQRGFADSLPISRIDCGARREFYTDHPANRELAGKMGCVDDYTHGVMTCAFACGEGCEPLAYTEENKNGLVSCALVHTAEGGLWGLVGQSLYTPIVNCEHRRQTTYLADYLAEGLPAYFETDDQAMLIPRVDREGYCVACTVLNLTIGASVPYRLALRMKPGTHPVLTRPEFADEMLPHTVDEQGVTHVELPSLAAWSTATLRAAAVATPDRTGKDA